MASALSFLSQHFHINEQDYECVNYSPVTLPDGTVTQHQLAFEPGSRELSIDVTPEFTAANPDLEDAMNDKITSFLMWEGKTSKVEL
jgi:hypothetical protein